MQTAYEIAINIIRDMTDEQVCAYIGVNYYDYDDEDMPEIRLNATIQKAESLLEQNMLA